MRVARALALTVYSAEPGTDSENRLKLLASWAVTHATTDAAIGSATSRSR